MKSLLKKFAFLAGGLPVFWAAGHASAARFPNSVSKTFSISGEAALEWAKVLGLNLSEKQTLDFPLNTMEAHALSLRANSPKPAAAPPNQIIFDPAKKGLTLSGNWLDQTTGSNPATPRHTFSSGFISEDLKGAGPWADLLRAFGFPKSAKASRKFGEVLERRTTPANQTPWLEVKVYQHQSYEMQRESSWGYQVVIGVEE